MILIRLLFLALVTTLLSPILLPWVIIALITDSNFAYMDFADWVLGV